MPSLIPNLSQNDNNFHRNKSSEFQSKRAHIECIANCKYHVNYGGKRMKKTSTKLQSFEMSNYTH